MNTSTLDIFIVAMADRSNFVFSIIIFVLTLLGAFASFSQKHQNFRYLMPSLVAGLGVFGTFWGIFLGLYEFDTTNISESVPKLLDGMKIAFFTSLIGMLASFILKFFYSIKEDRNHKAVDELTLLQQIADTTSEFSQKISRLDETLNKVFRSDDDYSLVSQVKLIRQDITDNHRETQKVFREMLNTFSEMASKSLVEQLKNVVEEFNVMLNELVAQSFKELRISTERLNEWQAEYKDTIQKNQENLQAILLQLSALSETYNMAIQRVQELSKLLESMDASLKGLGLSGELLSKISLRLNQQMNSMHEFLIAIRTTGEEAAKVLPAIAEKTDGIIHELSRQHASTTQFVERTTSELENSQHKLAQSLEQYLLDMQDTAKNTEESLKRSVQEIQKSSENNIRKTEESLEKELSKSLESLGGALVQLSNKFCSDYLPLTERLSALVRMVEQGSTKHLGR